MSRLNKFCTKEKVVAPSPKEKNFRRISLPFPTIPPLKKTLQKNFGGNLMGGFDIVASNVRILLFACDQSTEHLASSTREDANSSSRIPSRKVRVKKIIERAGVNVRAEGLG